MNWTAKDAAKFDRMRGNGKTYRQIAAALGRSLDSVYSFNRDRSRREGRAPPKPKRLRYAHPTAQQSTERLRIAVLQAICGYANINNIHVDHAARVLLSGARLAA